MKAQKLALYLTVLSFVLAVPTHAQEDSGEDVQEQSGEAQAVDVKDIKNKYWAKGEKTKLGVVQNRKYTKSGKFEIGAFGAFISTDPFINVKAMGLRMGYHINENFGVSLFAWRDFVSKSGAQLAFEQNTGGSANTNDPFAFYGLEGTASFLYGKLSLFGQKIIYYDLFFAGGGGLTVTETGNSPSALIGLGQRFFVSDHFSLRFDYRVIYFREDVPEKTIPSLAYMRYPRTNFTHAIALGVDFLFN